MRKKLILFLSTFLLLIFGDFSVVRGQVTIGSPEIPAKHAILDIKDQKPTVDGGVTAAQGALLMPRVELVKQHELLPFAQVSDIGTADYENVQKKVHTGLTVYNLKDVLEEDLFVGINVWDGQKWNAMSEKLGLAGGIVGSCDSVTFIGVYKNKEALTSSNYMTIPLIITKPGSYTITATADPDNGYYFTTSGMFLSKGYYYLSIPASGTPVNFTPDGELGDKMVIRFNGQVIDCSKYVKVEDSSVKANYKINCASVKVNGVYSVDKPLDPTKNTITLSIDVDPSATGALYVIKTNTVDGISFSGSAYLTPGIQLVTLAGAGIPTSMADKVMTISTNSASTLLECSATVKMAFSPKRILFLGFNSGTYYYNFNGGMTAQLINTKTNFGLLDDSKVKIEGFTRIDGGNTTSPTAADLATYLTGTNPVDIVIMSYDSYQPTSVANADLFAQYLANGGVLLTYSDNASRGTADAQRLLRAIFADDNISVSTKGFAGSVYKLTYENHPILNGPFGDIRGKYWGEDASATMGVSNLPSGSITVLSSDTDYSSPNVGATGSVTAFVHNKLNFMWIGDGGFNSAAIDASRTAVPFRINTTTGLPISKLYGRGTALNVDNSTLTANAIAWAMLQAEFKNK